MARAGAGTGRPTDLDGGRPRSASVTPDSAQFRIALYSEISSGCATPSTSAGGVLDSTASSARGTLAICPNSEIHRSMVAMVLFNVGWMTRYRGDTPSDRIINGGRYVVDNGIGGEVENFLPRGGRLRGYVQLPGATLRLENLGASPDSSFLDSATVVFTATRPGGGGYVVGWYSNARVHRQHQPQGRYGYIAEAQESDCKLLDLDDRVFPVPRARAGVFGLGQSNVRYLHTPEAKPFVRDLRHYIRRDGRPRRPPPRAGARQTDTALRKRVETAAVECVVQHYRGRGFTCRSVERDNVGWDLVCVREGLKLLVGVKACSGRPHVELTPNEYAAMNGRHRDRYRLAIVSTALANPVLSIVQYSRADGTWRDQHDRVADLQEQLGVRVRINPRHAVDGTLLVSSHPQRSPRDGIPRCAWPKALGAAPATAVASGGYGTSGATRSFHACITGRRLSNRSSRA